MSKGWSKERREKQSLRIKTSRPWERATGPRTQEGKKKSSQNAWKGRGHKKEEIIKERKGRLETKYLFSAMHLLCSGFSSSRVSMWRIKHVLKNLLSESKVEKALIKQVTKSLPEIQVKVLNKVIEFQNINKTQASQHLIKQYVQEMLKVA